MSVAKKESPGRRWALASLLYLSAVVVEAGDDLTRPICVSDDGHFLVQPNGDPFFWLADTAWSLFMRLTREEADQYLKDRAAKGFNVIQAVTLGGPLDFLNVPNRYGHLPLVDGDFTRPNPRYFEHVDWVVTRAAEYRLRIAMLPVWGFRQVSLDRALDAPTAETYGRWIGERYRGQGVVWILGGDTTPMWGTRAGKGDGQALIGSKATSINDTRPIYDAMAVGLIAGDGGDPFLTFHPTNLSFSGTAHPRTSLYFHDRAWLDMNMLQSSHFIDPSAHLESIGADFSWLAPFSYQPIGQEYQSMPVRPVIDGEPRFEDLAIDLDRNAAKGYWSGYDARNAAYHALFAGAAGHTYGNHSVWQFFDPGHQRLYQLPRKEVTWRVALDRASTAQMQHAKTLLLSRPYFSRIPDQSIIASAQEEGIAHINATRDREGSYALIYLPHGQSVTLNMNKISGLRAVAWWFDPRTGRATRIPETFATNGQATFVAPSRGAEEDWVLVVDDERRHFGPPGAASSSEPGTSRPCDSRQTS